uniref:Uncharacterized protein n=1 Tax=Oryza brachyantha TaxID=4533 RepID=J3LCC4_ORYBR
WIRLWRCLIAKSINQPCSEGKSNQEHQTLLYCYYLSQVNCCFLFNLYDFSNFYVSKVISTLKNSEYKVHTVTICWYGYIFFGIVHLLKELPNHTKTWPHGNPGEFISSLL